MAPLFYSEFSYLFGGGNCIAPRSFTGRWLALGGWGPFWRLLGLASVTPKSTFPKCMQWSIVVKAPRRSLMFADHNTQKANKQPQHYI